MIKLEKTKLKAEFSLEEKIKLDSCFPAKLVNLSKEYDAIKDFIDNDVESLNKYFFYNKIRPEVKMLYNKLLAASSKIYATIEYVADFDRLTLTEEQIPTTLLEEGETTEMDALNKKRQREGRLDSETKKRVEPKKSAVFLNIRLRSSIASDTFPELSINIYFIQQLNLFTLEIPDKEAFTTDEIFTGLFDSYSTLDYINEKKVRQIFSLNVISWNAK